MLLFALLANLVWITVTMATYTTFTESDKTAIINAHNTLRSKVANGNQAGQGTGYTFPKAIDMIRLEWDDALAEVANDYADTCPGLYHSDSTDRKNALDTKVNSECKGTFPYSSGSVGENMGFHPNTPSISVVLELLEIMLDDEATNYKYGTKYGDPFNYPTVNYPNATDDCTDNTQCGHFTAGIWGNTRYVGCGFKHCPSSTYETQLVCNFYPGGNVIYQLIYTSGSTTCSSCPSGSTCDSDGLCAYPASSPNTCSPTLSPTGSTPSPVPGSPTTPPSCYTISNSNFGGYFDGNWNVYGTSNGEPVYKHSSSGYYLEYGTPGWLASRYAIKSTLHSSSSSAWCESSDITNCIVGQWTVYDGSVWSISSEMAISTGCSSSARIIVEEKHESSLIAPEIIETDGNDSIDAVKFNMNEIHIISGLLGAILITICGIAMMICWYINKQNKVQLNDEKQMRYFESNEDGKSATNANNINEDKSTLRISIGEKKIMNKPVQQTTPVTPLIDEQCDNMLS